MWGQALSFTFFNIDVNEVTTDQGETLHGRKEYTKPGVKGNEKYLYSAFYILCISQSAQAWITQFYLQGCNYTMPTFPS